VIELVCSVYGVNKVWLKTGNGVTFDRNIDSQIEEMTDKLLRKSVDDTLTVYYIAL
jgi:hypothetical protein